MRILKIFLLLFILVSIQAQDTIRIKVPILSGGGGGGSGTVTSVGLSSGSLTVTGSPVTTSGIISANISDTDKGDITVSSSGTNWQIDTDAVGAPEIAAGAVGTSELATAAVTTAKIAQNGATTGQILKWNGSSWYAADDATSSGSGGGTVTSVAVVSGGGINVTGSPITTSGTITLTAADDSAANELQNLTLSGQSLGISSGTGVTLPVVGITAGSNVTVSNTAGNYTINSTATTAWVDWGPWISPLGVTSTEGSGDKVQIGKDGTGGSPTAMLTVYGQTYLKGSLKASDGTTGANGQVLTSTGTGTTYSSLPVTGITAGTGISVSNSSGNYTISSTATMPWCEIFDYNGGTYNPGSGTYNFTNSNNPYTSYFTVNLSTDEVTVLAAGYYEIEAYVDMSHNQNVSTGCANIMIDWYTSGAWGATLENVIYANYNQGVSGRYLHGSGKKIVYLNANDKLRCYYTVCSGYTLSTLQNHFFIKKIS